MLQRNFHALVEKTADLGKCKEKLSQNEQNVCLQDNEQLCLNAILQKDDRYQRTYLFIITDQKAIDRGRTGYGTKNCGKECGARNARA